MTPSPVRTAVLLASTIGQIGHPFYLAFAWVLAAIYSVIPNYAIAIALLTVAVMVVVFPFTLKGTRGMMKMQLLAPELKQIQNRHKVTPGMSLDERQEARRALNEEMMALYRENNASPTGGCVPLLLQMPVFLILYGTIRGLTHQTVTKVGSVVHTTATPLYISSSSRLYQDIQHAHGALNAFGINLADSVRSGGLSWSGKLPYIALILIATGLQYLQMARMSGRTPAARQANPQMQQMQKIFPLILSIVYISIPAGVNVYFIVSSLFRVAQQELMYRRDPELQRSMEQLQARHAASKKVIDTKAVPAGAPIGGRFARLRAAAQGLQPTSNEPTANGSGHNGTGRTEKPSYTPPRQANRSSSSGGTRKAGSAKPAQPRAAGKRPRRPR